MSIARVKVQCPVCGEWREIHKTCHNSREAVNYEAFHANSKETCYRCLLEEAKEKVKKIAPLLESKYAVPPISIGTDKQIAYARDIRCNYLVACSCFDVRTQSLPMNVARTMIDAKAWIEHADYYRINFSQLDRIKIKE